VLVEILSRQGSGGMSRKVATLVYSKQVGSMARKAVLAYFADRANDDGSGVWTAKQRVADEIECSKQTVITIVKALVADGLVSETGRRPNSNGYTVEYSINLSAVEALPDSKRVDEEVQILTGQDLDGSTPQTPRGQAALPKPSLNRPKPKKDKPSLERARAKKPAHPMPEDWMPKPLTPGTVCAQIVLTWQPGRIERELSKFRDHHLRSDTMWSDWDAAWRTWIQRAGDFERGDNGRTNGMGRHQSPDGLSDTTRAALRVFGAAEAGDEHRVPQ
jgi:hypothetical protein